MTNSNETMMSKEMLAAFSQDISARLHSLPEIKLEDLRTEAKLITYDGLLESLKTNGYLVKFVEVIPAASKAEKNTVYVYDGPTGRGIAIHGDGSEELTNIYEFAGQKLKSHAIFQRDFRVGHYTSVLCSFSLSGEPSIITRESSKIGVGDVTEERNYRTEQDPDRADELPSFRVPSPYQIFMRGIGKPYNIFNYVGVRSFNPNRETPAAEEIIALLQLKEKSQV